MSRPIQIAPSVLPADFSRLGEEVAALEAAGVDLIQWDVMDGQFVPNLTFGPDVIASARPHTSVPFEAHLMVYTPDVMAKQYIDAGCSRLIVHAEACTHLHRTLANINDLGANAAVALNPATPASAIAHVLDLVDLVLVMTVNPGFGGQAYIATMEPKIAEIRSMIDAAGLADTVDLEVDGGIGPSTIAGAAAAGANVLIAGSALYKDPDGLDPRRRRPARPSRSRPPRLTRSVGVGSGKTGRSAGGAVHAPHVRAGGDVPLGAHLESPARGSRRRSRSSRSPDSTAGPRRRHDRTSASSGVRPVPGAASRGGSPAPAGTSAARRACARPSPRR